jgi:uncharacterized protein (TIGR02246 family)
MSTTTDDAAADASAALRGVLDRWKAGVDAHEPERVASAFTEDAIFQGLHPYSVGRQGVADYYAAQPLDMRVVYRILETRPLADDLVLGYLGVEFSFSDQATRSFKLGVLARRVGDDWLLAHYQISRLD